MKPELLIFDEPTSSLDLSTQAQVAKLIRDIASDFDFTYIFITHNLELIWYMCDRICVMRQGRVIEVNDKKTIFENPQDPYTQELISAVTMHDSL
jgi:ABC-type dipeptide/oligopeptide/nickel transport system ATPase component